LPLSVMVISVSTKFITQPPSQRFATLAWGYRPVGIPRLTAREQIDDGGHIEPALCGPDIGEVGDPFVVGSGCVDAAVEHIGSDGGGRSLTQIGRQAPPSRTCPESVLPHQSFDPMQPAVAGLLHRRTFLPAKTRIFCT
jgi:hypothetical protein